MSTAEVSAYLWGQETARQALRLQVEGGDVEAWLEEPADTGWGSMAAQLGPVRLAYWIRRGYEDFAAEHLAG